MTYLTSESIVGGEERELKILALSDFHGFLPSFYKTVEKASMEKVDLLVVAGDITHFGDLETAEKLLKILTQSEVEVLFVPGNCDPPSLASVNWDQPRCIHGRIFNEYGFDFIGVGGALKGPFYTLFEVKDDEIEATLERELEGERLIVVSHTPPKDTRVDLTRFGLHVGSLSLRRFIEGKKPLCVVCGHIHEARGVDSIGSTVLVNPGPARDGYCAIIEINGEVDVNLDRL